MRAFRLGLAALAFGATVSGCSGGKSGALAPLNTTPKEAEAYIAKLVAEPFKGEATAPADIAAVRDALPKEISLTWGALNFDAASGATVLTDVKLSPADMPAIGLGIQEIRLWDFDADFAKARLTGQRLGEAGSLARRIEAKGIAVFGLETLANPPPPSPPEIVRNPASPPTAEEPPPPPQIDWEAMGRAPPVELQPAQLESYEISIARFVLDDVVLRPFELTPARVEPGSDLTGMMPVLQGLAALTRTFAADTMAVNGFTTRIDLIESGRSISVGLGADSFGARGMRGGDLDVAFLRGPSLEISGPTMTFGWSAIDTETTSMSLGADLYTIEKMRLGKLLGYLAKGQWPPRTDTDLMSLGLLQAANQRISVDGSTLFSVAQSTIDARAFHWFIPTSLRLSASDVVYDIPGVMAVAPMISPMMMDEEAKAAAAQVIDLLAKYDLSRPSFDYTLGWNWNPNSGATTIDGAFGIDRFMRLDAKLEGTLPSFRSVSDLIPGGFETADGEAISQVFGNALSLRLVEANIIDEGGLDKGFALAVELGKMIPTEQGQVNFFANQTPESLRQAAVALIYAGRDQAARQVPALKELLSPFGAFVDKGGKVRISYKPAKPFDQRLAQDISTGMVTPADLLKDVKVVHTPPAGGPVKPN